jgi:hypothetical protein
MLGTGIPNGFAPRKLWPILVLALVAGCSGRSQGVSTQLPGGRNVMDNPFVPGSSRHQVSVRRGPTSLQCARNGFIEAGYEFASPASPADTTDMVGARFATVGRDRFQELVRLEARLEEDRPVVEMTVGRPMITGALSQGALPASHLWIKGTRRTVKQADEILRKCQGSPFGG